MRRPRAGHPPGQLPKEACRATPRLDRPSLGSIRVAVPTLELGRGIRAGVNLAMSRLRCARKSDVRVRLFDQVCLTRD